MPALFTMAPILKDKKIGLLPTRAALMPKSPISFDANIFMILNFRNVFMTLRIEKEIAKKLVSKY